MKEQEQGHEGDTGDNPIGLNTIHIAADLIDYLDSNGVPVPVGLAALIAAAAGVAGQMAAETKRKTGRDPEETLQSCHELFGTVFHDATEAIGKSIDEAA